MIYISKLVKTDNQNRLFESRSFYACWSNIICQYCELSSIQLSKMSFCLNISFSFTMKYFVTHSSCRTIIWLAEVCRPVPNPSWFYLKFSLSQFRQLIIDFFGSFGLKLVSQRLSLAKKDHVDISITFLISRFVHLSISFRYLSSICTCLPSVMTAR